MLYLSQKAREFQMKFHYRNIKANILNMQNLSNCEQNQMWDVKDVARFELLWNTEKNW